MHQFIENCRKPAEQRERGELKPLELSNAEEVTIRDVHSRVYVLAAEIEALKGKKQIERGRQWHHSVQY